MSDAGLVVAALLGMMLTAGAILRDTRDRRAVLRDGLRRSRSLTLPPTA